MKVTFSMDGIKNMDQLYTWTKERSEEFGCDCTTEHYHGAEYCKAVVDSLTGWVEKQYIGSRERIANETFVLKALDGAEYTVAFTINTYDKRAAHLEVSLVAPDVENYDHVLEGLKVTLKDRLILDWQECTWLVDEQAAKICKDAYEKTFAIENDLRAFASKVLIHFLGVNWLQRTGLEKEAESSKVLREKFIQRVPEFDNINTDFLSMTLETLVGIMFDGIVYEEDIVLGQQDYKKALEICKNAKSAANVANFIQNRRVEDKKIWEDLFVPFINDPDAFKGATHNFIEDRNHVAHSKVLSWSAYQVIMNDFKKMDELVDQADEKFEQEETSEELLATWVAEQEEESDADYAKSYYRDRLAAETGMDILGEDEIRSWFDVVLYDLHSDVYQRYHLDVSYEVSDFSTPAEGDTVFSVSCPVDDDLSISVAVVYCVDDDLGEDSTCHIFAKNARQVVVCRAEVHFHNGDGFEGEEGQMIPSDATEYDTAELDEFKVELFDLIESLNPYPAKADTIAYRNKGAVQVIADFPCEQCGKRGVSLDEELLPIGKCCYCGWENDLVRCKRCGGLISVGEAENGLCPSCATYIGMQ